MARILSQTLIRPSSTSPLGLSTPRILTQRHRSDQSGSGKAQLIEVDLESDGGGGEVEVLGIKRLEDVIHNIIVKRSAPDWLPFIPGSSYYVPPRRRPYGVVDVLNGKIANPSSSLTEEETMSLTTVRGWPSSSYLIQGTLPFFFLLQLWFFFCSLPLGGLIFAHLDKSPLVEHPVASRWPHKCFCSCWELTWGATQNWT